MHSAWYVDGHQTGLQSLSGDLKDVYERCWSAAQVVSQGMLNIPLPIASPPAGKSMIRPRRSTIGESRILPILDLRAGAKSEGGTGPVALGRQHDGTGCQLESTVVQSVIEQYQDCYDQGVRTARNDASNLVCQSAYDAVHRGDEDPDPYAIEPFDLEKDTPATSPVGKCVEAVR